MAQLMYQIAHLPNAIQKQVMDFIDFLMSKYRQEQSKLPEEKKYPLRGSVTYYDRPFDAVGKDDWDALG